MKKLIFILAIVGLFAPFDTLAESKIRSGYFHPRTKMDEMTNKVIYHKIEYADAVCTNWNRETRPGCVESLDDTVRIEFTCWGKDRGKDTEAILSFYITVSSDENWKIEKLNGWGEILRWKVDDYLGKPFPTDGSEIKSRNKVSFLGITSFEDWKDDWEKERDEVHNTLRKMLEKMKTGSVLYMDNGPWSNLLAFEINQPTFSKIVEPLLATCGSR